MYRVFFKVDWKMYFKLHKLKHMFGGYLRKKYVIKLFCYIPIYSQLVILSPNARPSFIKYHKDIDVDWHN